MRVYWSLVLGLNFLTGFYFVFTMTQAQSAPQEAALGAAVAVLLIGPYVFGRALEGIIGTKSEAHVRDLRSLLGDLLVITRDGKDAAAKLVAPTRE